MAVSLFWLAMQMYLADCVFPEIEGQLAAYKSFCELWDSGEMAKLDMGFRRNGKAGQL